MPDASLNTTSTCSESTPSSGAISPDAEDRPHGPKTVIISYALWRNTFASKANIIGQNILLKGEPYTVIGVLPDGADNSLERGHLHCAPARATTAKAAEPTSKPSPACAMAPPGNRPMQRSTVPGPCAPSRYELEENPGAQVSYYSVPLQIGQAATLRPQALALMLAAGFILLIACANLAGLTLVRMLRRTPEIATRLALGASRWRIQRQLWVETLLLAFLGGVAGVAVGFIALRGLLLLLPEHFLPVASVPLDGRVLAFTLVISLLTSVLFGMLPALTTRKLDLRSAIASRTATAGEHLRLRQALIATEVALTVVLLAASGLLIHTLIHLQTLPPGFNPNGVMTARASLDDVRFHDPVTFRKLLDESVAAMRQIPGVESAAMGLSLPYERSIISVGPAIRDGKEAGQLITADQTYVTPDYFATLQIPVLAGRAFTPADGPDTQRVAIVNRTLARKFFHDSNPVGRHFFENTLIVGVVEDVAIAPGIDSVAPITNEPTMYIPAAQMLVSQLTMYHVWFQPSWIVRTAAPVEGLTAQMQRALAGVDPDLPFNGFYSMRDILAKTLATQRVEVALLSAMAALALLLSAVGIFALIANIVAQKTREIGIRIALGSTVRQAMLHIAGPGVSASALGLVIGLILCAGALRAMRSVLYGVGVYDAPTILIVVLTLASAILIASIVPTMRIAGIDPATTLREE